MKEPIVIRDHKTLIMDSTPRYVFTPEEFEKLAGEIWEAANDRQADYVDSCTTGAKVVHPDKDTYISSLTNKKQ